MTTARGRAWAAVVAFAVTASRAGAGFAQTAPQSPPQAQGAGQAPAGAPPQVQAAIDAQIEKLRADQQAALDALKAQQDAALARMQAEHEAALAALAARQAELDRRLGELADQQAARDHADAETAKARASEPAPGVALSVVGMPVRVFGNATLRYDYSVNSNLTDTLTNGVQSNWLLLRVRFGAEFGDTGPVLGGIRISSGESPNPTVPFVVLSDAFRPASFGLDQAWTALRPLSDRDRLQIALGRLKNPFWRGSIGSVRTQMVWDDDVNPAGAAVTGQLYKTNASSSFPFLIEDAFAYMQAQALLDNRFVGLTGVVSGVGNQLRFLSKYLDAAVSYYAWWNLNTGLSVPTAQPAQGYDSPQPATSAFLLQSGLQRTNTIVNYGLSGGAASGFLDPTFNILNPAAEFKLPFKHTIPGDIDAYVLVDYAHNFLPQRQLSNGNLPMPNPATCKSCTAVATSQTALRDASQRSDGFGVTVGTRLGDGTYQHAFHPMNVWATYRYVQSDAVLATFTDSDLGAGTGYQGFGLGLNYRLFKNLFTSVQYFDFMGYPNMENHVRRLFFDVMGDF